MNPIRWIRPDWCGLAIGEAVQLTVSIGVIASLDRKLRVARHGAATSANLHPDIADPDGFHPATTHLHARNIVNAQATRGRLVHIRRFAE